MTTLGIRLIVLVSGYCIDRIIYRPVSTFGQLGNIHLRYRVSHVVGPESLGRHTTNMGDRFLQWCSHLTRRRSLPHHNLRWKQRGGRRFYEAVYTLSIPSFTWINATSVSYQSNAEQRVNATAGRSSQSCQVYKGAQLVVVGGSVQLGNDTQDSCNPVFSPLRALDLSTYTWQTIFDPNVTYQVPPVVYHVIGGK